MPDYTLFNFQYLGWMNNKKSRIMDQFKKIDKNNLGKVTKQEFIEGILKSSKKIFHSLQYFVLCLYCIINIFYNCI